MSTGPSDVREPYHLDPLSVNEDSPPPPPPPLASDGLNHTEAPVHMDDLEGERTSVDPVPSPPLPRRELRRSDRAVEDQELVDRLRSNGFDGPAFTLFLEELLKYGLAVCKGWIGSGRMIVKCAAAGRPVGEPPWPLTPEDIADLAVDTAFAGALLFKRDALVGGQWSVDQGTSLTTFYIGACIQVYPTVYRSWFRASRSVRRLRQAEELTDEIEDPASDMDRVNDQLLIQNVMERLRQRDPRSHDALRLWSEGRSYADIARALGISPKAVDGVLSRAKLWCRRAIGDMGGAIDP